MRHMGRGRLAALAPIPPPPGGGGEVPYARRTSAAEAGGKKTKNTKPSAYGDSKQGVIDVRRPGWEESGNGNMDGNGERVQNQDGDNGALKGFQLTSSQATVDLDPQVSQ